MKQEKKVKIKGDPGLMEWQKINCVGCYFADSKVVGTGLPCCSTRIEVDRESGKCLTRKELQRREGNDTK